MTYTKMHVVPYVKIIILMQLVVHFTQYRVISSMPYHSFFIVEFTMYHSLTIKLFLVCPTSFLIVEFKMLLENLVYLFYKCLTMSAGIDAFLID